MTENSAGHRALRVLGFAALAGLVIAIALTQPDYRLSYWSTTVATTVAVLGLYIITGQGGQISVGHSAFWGLGAYVTAVLVGDYNLTFLSVLPIVAVCGLVAGLIVGLPALRIRGLYLALITLAVALAFPTVVKLDALDKYTNGANGKSISITWTPPAWLPVDLTPLAWKFLTLSAIALLMFVLARNALNSRVGRALRALQANEAAAAITGINLARAKLAAFAVSAAYGAVAGGMLTLAVPIVSPEAVGFMLGVNFLAALVLGGKDSLLGPILGAALIVWLPSLTSSWAGYVPGLSPSSGPLYASAVYGMLLLFVVLALPGGLGSVVTGAGSRLFRVVPAGNPVTSRTASEGQEPREATLGRRAEEGQPASVTSDPQDNERRSLT